jgi:hypothetical protein
MEDVAGKRKTGLSETYTFEYPQDVVDMSDHDFLTEELTRYINDQILMEVYESQGWHKVARTDAEWDEQIKPWLDTHCKHSFYLGYNFCMFADLDDASVFSMTWT